ncbi:ABCC3 [Symbiodinium microadriaticum]|nr:ABCC3 [Symbiodinium microadriaticum]
MDGRVEFRDVYLRYRPNTPLVLKGVSFSVKSGERIGICGRTGAGKSSIMQALFRIVEADRGDIHIAGVNIKHIPLRFLRARLAIIPQDPVIFGGSVRYQLDPFEEYPDDAIWAVLGKVNMAAADEATSAVDPNTDDLIQTVLREEAQREGTTILTIAHRLHTIVDFDRILVLGEGEVIEYDTPTYLSDSDSEFSRMLSDYNSQHNHHPST